MNDEAFRFFERLSQEDLDLIFSRLLGYTINLVDRYHWRYGIMPAGIDPQDIVQRIFVKTLTGKINWDPNKIDILAFMQGRVWGETTRLFVKKEYKHERHAYEEEDFNEIVDRELSLEEELEIDTFYDPAAWVEAIDDEQERIRVIQTYIEELLEACQGKPELEEVVYAILNGCEEKTRYLAEWLGIPENEVNNRLKRLRRRADRIKEKKVTREQQK